ncbi:MAG TPA: hypothetical protein VF527_16135 [Pyrinomonadaceae bacterium]|jgi:hypothetical protein
MEIGALVSAVRSTQSLISFLLGGASHDILSGIGDTHLESALSALRSAKSANNPHIFIAEARGHLRTAHVSYQRIWKKRDTTFRRSVQGLSAETAADKDFFVCCLAVLCSLYLEEPKDIEQSLSDARIALRLRRRWFEAASDEGDEGTLHVLGTLAGALLNPTEWGVFGHEWIFDFDSAEDFDEFGKFEKAVKSYKK